MNTPTGPSVTTRPRPIVTASLTALALLAVLLGWSAPPTASALTDDPAATARAVEVRVATYNIHTGIGVDGRLDLSRTAEAIQDMNADVIGLQEVDVHWAARSDWRDQARDLAEALDMRVFFAPIYSLDPPAADAPRREYGLAILTRLPVLHTENHSITRLSTQDPNAAPQPAPGFPEVVVNAEGAVVHIYATHLDFRADPEVRQMQVADTLRIMRDDGPDAQQVLVGDFNARPGAAELAPLWDQVTDTWTAAGDGAGQTYPAAAPDRRIDYVTASATVEVTRVEVPATLASDHRPVVADLVVTRGW